jgi:hypothetical protein
MKDLYTEMQEAAEQGGIPEEIKDMLRAQYDDLRPLGDIASLAPEIVGLIQRTNATGFEEAVQQKFQHAKSVLLQKHKDYGPKNIALAPGGAINGLRVRMHDKLARINNLVDKGGEPQHESLEDSFKDMANYAIIGLLVLRKQWDSGK